ncbi:unnamed protein product, partial [marine sediment metagenome]
TASANPELHAEFIAAKAPDAPSREEEVAAVGADAIVEKSITIFPRVGGKPILWDYQVKGFFKDACGMLARAVGTKSADLKAYKKTIDGLIFVHPRAIPLHITPGQKIVECQRPLRAQTAQGERVALAHSESAPAGTYIEIEIEAFKLQKKKGVNLDECLIEWLDYGKLRGFGQWRNSGKGRFEWEEIKTEKKEKKEGGKAE